MCRNSLCEFSGKIHPTKRLDSLSLVDKRKLSSSGAWCASDGTLTRNARTIDSSSFLMWPRVFRDLWTSRTKLWEWSKNGAVSLARFTSTLKTPMHIEFGPEDGKRAAVTYQRRYGYRGEWLIEQLGNGLGPGLASLYSQSVPNTFLTPPLSSTRT
ncbi:uncharacterized protein LOC105181364 [Harpegnathos saltator]|uniref:uncharacterized protein LOC105181364 n=1 Tax=Harpegnathos saltator TaxID=610380 RepID=UPI00058B4C95|nr:uncharacterized protein LOC105181364 [Harpegnathos saltator]